MARSGGSLDVTNLFDAEYAAYKLSSVYNDTPEEGRNFRAGLGASF